MVIQLTGKGYHRQDNEGTQVGKSEISGDKKKLLIPSWAGDLDDDEAEFIAQQLKVNGRLKQLWELRLFMKASGRSHLKICPKVVKELNEWWLKRATVGTQMPLPEKKGRFLASFKNKDGEKRIEDTTPPNGSRAPYWLGDVFIIDGYGWVADRTGATACVGTESSILARLPQGAPEKINRPKEIVRALKRLKHFRRRGRLLTYKGKHARSATKS